MRRKLWLIASSGSLLLGFLTVSVQAASMSGTTGNLKVAAGEILRAQQEHHRYGHRCRWYRGHVHCWWARPRAYIYPYYSSYDYGNPYSYGYGYPSLYGPSFGFSFGHHHHHYHGHGHHHHHH